MSLLGVTILPIFVSDPSVKMTFFVLLVFLSSVVDTIITGGFAVWHLKFMPENIRADFISINTLVTNFLGISAALLACSNPIGTVFSSLFISYITVGGTKLSTQYYTKEIADVITALIIYLCAFSLLFKNKIRALLIGKKKHMSVKGGND